METPVDVLNLVHLARVPSLIDSVWNAITCKVKLMRQLKLKVLPSRSEKLLMFNNVTTTAEASTQEEDENEKLLRVTLNGVVETLIQLTNPYRIRRTGASCENAEAHDATREIVLLAIFPEECEGTFTNSQLNSTWDCQQQLVMVEKWERKTQTSTDTSMNPGVGSESRESHMSLETPSRPNQREAQVPAVREGGSDHSRSPCSHSPLYAPKNPARQFGSGSNNQPVGCLLAPFGEESAVHKDIVHALDSPKFLKYSRYNVNTFSLLFFVDTSLSRACLTPKIPPKDSANWTENPEDLTIVLQFLHSQKIRARQGGNFDKTVFSEAAAYMAKEFPPKAGGPKTANSIADKWKAVLCKKLHEHFLKIKQGVYLKDARVPKPSLTTLTPLNINRNFQETAQLKARAWADNCDIFILQDVDVNVLNA
ncbi:hypothetical protein B0H14DRAFT_2615217 [Mycena olivaceomarginata]|nr:hypothetical protein B0H14DRAFT_2615217 [Mycena olivaceomarginata]